MTEDESAFDKIAVHYIGWEIKWDEWVGFKPENICSRLSSRIEERNTKTIGSYHPRDNRDPYYEYDCF